MKRTVLLVAMPGSIHVARWIKQLGDQNLDIHLFPSTGGIVIHPEMEGVTFHSPLFPWSKRIENSARGGRGDGFSRAATCIGNWLKSVVRGRQERKRVAETTTVARESLGYLNTGSPRLTAAQHFRQFLRQQFIERFMPGFRVKRLLKVIQKIHPDLVHSLEIQAAGSLTLDVKNKLSGKFPPWLVTNWGSDIYLFGRLQKYKARIGSVLANCDFYSCECERDVNLAKQFGFSGQTMPVFPNTGGFDLQTLAIKRNEISPSTRRVIMLKGYQNWAGRALVGLRALSRCEDVLRGYSVCIYLASPDVELAAELFSVTTGIPVRLVPYTTSHLEILSLHAQARISIGLSISDAISTSFLEALVMGSFPIQSCTACADEWITHGVSGMIVPPEDPDIIELAIRTALLDDDLVNKAAEKNWNTAQSRLSVELLKQKSIEMYSRLLDGEDPGVNC